MVSTERRGSFLSINSAVQQISVGSASIIAGLVVVKTSTNAIENYEITGYIGIAVTLISIFFVSKLNTRLKLKEGDLNKEEQFLSNKK